MTAWPDWQISTVAGNGAQGYAGDDGPAIEARLDNPFDIAFDPAGRLVFTDTFNHCIRRVDLQSGGIATIAGAGAGADADARFNEPYGLVIDRSGTIYTADRLNRRVCRIDQDFSVTTLAGPGEGLVEPKGLALSLDHTRLLIADVADHRVRTVDLATLQVGTLAGTGEAAHNGDGGLAVEAAIFGARAVAVGPDGAVFVLERQGGTLRRIDPASGIIETFAGTGKRGYGGDGGPANGAIFDRPKELAMMPSGDVLVVDTENHAIRLVSRDGRKVMTIAGSGTAGFCGDDIAALSACLARPHGAAVGPDGAIYVADSENHRIRKLQPVASADTA
jgi:DNA-binding beta-propeller fold protein YncE